MTNNEIVKKYLEHGVDNYSRVCKETGIQEQDFLYALAKAIEKHDLVIAREKASACIQDQQKARDMSEAKTGFNKFLNGIV